MVAMILGYQVNQYVLKVWFSCLLGTESMSKIMCVKLAHGTNRHN